MVDSLQIGAAVIVVFVLALTTEILFACCRVYSWLRRQLGGADPRVVPPGRYRRGSVSHSWSEATVENSTTAASHLNGSGGLSSSSSPDRLYTPVHELLGLDTATSVSAADRREHRGTTPLADGGGRDGYGPLVSHHLQDGRGTDHHLLSSDHNVDSLHVDDRRERSRSPGLRHHKLLFSTDFTQSPQQDWRSGQFSCQLCAVNLVGQRYILRDDQPYCKKCYEQQFANMCEACKTPITTDFKDLSYKDRHWHDKCFKCSSCPTSLVNESFAFKNEQLYCASCYERKFAPRCVRCGHVFRAGMKKYEHRGRQWHAECFICKLCSKQIGTNSFIPRGDEVVCVPCYEQQYSQTCTKCSAPIAKGRGIVYNNSPWHRDCFCCSHCQRVLGRERFTSVKDQPYCVQCYGQLFAKKCSTCDKPITGVDGSKFIAFDGRQWHADCFVCYKCRSMLFGRGFLTDGSDILCPDCCKDD
jgi:LIM domain-containing protein 2